MIPTLCEALLLRGRGPGPQSPSPLCDTESRHRVWSVPRGWPGATWQVTAQPDGQQVSSDPQYNNGQQTHIKGFCSSSVQFFLFLCVFTFEKLQIFENFPTHLGSRQGCDLVLQQRNHETKATQPGLKWPLCTAKLKLQILQQFKISSVGMGKYWDATFTIRTTG